MAKTTQLVPKPDGGWGVKTIANVSMDNKAIDLKMEKVKILLN